MLENVRNRRRLFLAGDGSDLATAALADLNIDSEHSLEALHPSHGAVSLCRVLIKLIRTIGFQVCCYLPRLAGVT